MICKKELIDSMMQAVQEKFPHLEGMEMAEEPGGYYWIMRFRDGSQLTFRSRRSDTRTREASPTIPPITNSATTPFDSSQFPDQFTIGRGFEQEAGMAHPTPAKREIDPKAEQRIIDAMTQATAPKPAQAIPNQFRARIGDKWRLVEFIEAVHGGIKVREVGVAGYGNYHVLSRGAVDPRHMSILDSAEKSQVSSPVPAGETAS